MDKRFGIVLLLSAMVVLGQPGEARKDWPGSPLSSDVQIQLEKAGKLCKSGKHAQATPLILSALDQANDIPKCLAIAAFTEPYAYPMMDARRVCVNKALSLCQTRQDFIEIALKARQYQFFEITRQAINSLVSNAKSVPDLFDLARKSQEVALNDVARLAMDRAYSGIRSVPEAVKFANEVKVMGMEDLARKVEKDLLDDSQNARELCYLVKELEPLGMPDLSRYGLKKALDKAQTVEDFVDVYETARRLRQNDIYKVAEYRGKKLKLIQQIKNDREEYARQMQAWQEGVQQDLSRQLQEADRNAQAGVAPGPNAGSPVPDGPVSGF